MDFNKAALEMHETHHGKVGIVSKVEVKTRDDLSTAYTPGVAEPCRKIRENPDDVYKYTFKSNMVAVVSNGTAVLGLGDIGPEAGLPVMEGKAVLFKEFGGVDAFPICIDAHDAASVIACAGDEVQVYPGSMVMIHGVAGLLYDYYTLADLKKLQKDFDASERAIAEIYHAKTGLEVDQLRSMMTRETWMVGQEAIDNGFADTLLTDEGPDVTLSADKKVLLVAGIRHDVKGFRHIPGTIPIDNSIHAAPAAGNKHAAAKNDGTKKEDNKTMTLEEMRAQHPDVVAQIEQQAAETARTQERARIEAIDSIAASVGDAQLVRDAKYGETPCTAEQLALKAMQKQAALGAKHLKDAKADNDESGAAGVGAAPNGGEEGSESDDKAKVDAIVGLYNSTKSQNGGKK